MFVAGDLSQIESRVLCWLAGQEDKLELYRAGEDIYLPTAQQLGSDNRDLGKLLVLSAGFGASARVLIQKAKMFALEITEADAYRYIDAWRADNRRSSSSGTRCMVPFVTWSKRRSALIRSKSVA